MSLNNVRPQSLPSPSTEKGAGGGEDSTRLPSCLSRTSGEGTCADPGQR
jgi:hypothetical protein